ncbi:hypothetical protein K0M31_001495 [Melipona bicolor]|uniref:Uncharacterized protein n=1 Tax=Melipona bicolor TaxID=60889 RepID=A0AA40KY76_9HYME|nr:hypothetical protein K0M31_001495 [Melipona bicolor]
MHIRKSLRPGTDFVAGLSLAGAATEEDSRVQMEASTARSALVLIPLGEGGKILRVNRVTGDTSPVVFGDGEASERIEARQK